ncbi:MAG TPA: hypothetical protein VFK57_15695 [Vicinamibacterales bacterium]|nr:hypothetical protein [Vicinamibacterales bacterium]
MTGVRTFDLSADLDEVTPELVRAIRTATAAAHVVVLSTWNGCDKRTWDVPAETAPWGDVTVEWLLRAGQFRLDLKLWGRAIPPRFTPAALAREIARALGGPLLFSDCSLFPWSYLEATPDGAIWHVVARPNEEDRLDLLPAAPAGDRGREYFPPQLVYAAAEALADADPSAPDRSSPPDYCAVFNRSCPKALRCDRIDLERPVFPPGGSDAAV